MKTRTAIALSVTVFCLCLAACGTENEQGTVANAGNPAPDMTTPDHTNEMVGSDGTGTPKGDRVQSSQLSASDALTEWTLKDLCAEVARNVTEVKDENGASSYRDNRTGETQVIGCDGESATSTRCVVFERMIRKRVTTVTDLTSLSKSDLTVSGSRQYKVGAWIFDIWTDASLLKLPPEIDTYKKGQPVIVSGVITNVTLFEPPNRQVDNSEYGCRVTIEDAALESDGF